MAKVAAPGADDEERDESRDKAAEYEARVAAGRAKPPSGFFTIYKTGQGYWTRMGTAAAAGVLAVFTMHFLFTNLGRWLPVNTARTTIAAIVVAFLALYSLLIWWLMNKPTNADFLIATDSEMKKVNWTSRRELIGSTKVVIAFMFLIALFLFIVDIIFGWFFFSIDVMKFSPFQFGS